MASFLAEKQNAVDSTAGLFCFPKRTNKFAISRMEPGGSSFEISFIFCKNFSSFAPPFLFFILFFKKK